MCKRHTPKGLSVHILAVACRPQQRRPDVRTSIASACPSCGPHCCKANTKFSTPDASTSQDCLAAVFNQRQAQEPAPAQLRDGLHSQLASQQSSDVAEGKQEGWEEDSAPLPMRPAPYPAGPGRAIGHSPSPKPEALLMRPAGSGPGRAVEHSPFAKAPSGASPWSCPSGHGAGTHTEAATTSPGVGAEHASSVAAAAVQAAAPVASSTTRKRQRSSLTPGPATAARAASAAAVAAAFPYTLPASDAGIQPNRQQSNQEAKEPLPVQTPGSTGHAQTHSTGVSPAFTSPGSSLPIILSDSDDDKPTPKPHSSRTQIPSLSPTPPCSHSPCPTYRIWKPPRSMVRGTNAAAVASQGSAESPIVIEISDDDDSDEDCRKTTLDHVAAAAGSGSKFTSGISQRQAARHSSAGGSKEAEGQACLLGSKAAPQPLPFNLDTKGSARLSPSSLIIQPSSVGLVPASKQPLMKGSSKHSPASSHTSSQPANASEVQESIRQAARSSALLAVPRPGRANAVPSLASDTITASPGESLCSVMISVTISVLNRVLDTLLGD